MSPAALTPSARLVRAADAERADIERRRQLLLDRRETLCAELAETDGALAALNERERLLVRLTASPEPPRSEAGTDAPTASPPPVAVATAARPGKLLRGPEIRETAVSMLMRTTEAGAIHYRAWYEMLVEDGYEIAGKDPLAVFLTQITRSPLVKKSTQAGVYSIDLDAPSRLHSQLAQLGGSLRAVTVDAGADLAVARARRDEVLTKIKQTERALAEVTRVLGVALPEEPPRLASG